MMNRFAAARAEAALAGAKTPAAPHGARGHLTAALAHHAKGDHQGAKLAALRAAKALHALTGSVRTNAASAASAPPSALPNGAAC